MPRTTLSYKVLCKLLLVGLCSSCYSSKEVVVTLVDTASFPREMGQSFWTTNRIAPDSNTTAYARQSGLESYIVTQFHHRPWEPLYQKWKDGKADSTSFITTRNRYTKETVINNSLLVLDNESRFLFGRRKNGEYLVAADENNNNSFEDDSLRVIVPAKGKASNNITAERAIVRITNLKGYENENIFIISKTFELQATVASDSLLPPSDDFYLNLLSSESLVGRFRYKGKTHKVAMRNCGFPILANRPEFELLKFAKGNEDSAFLKRWNTRPEYRVGDTVALGKRVFLIKEASSLDGYIMLKPLRIRPSLVTPKRIGHQLETTAVK